MPLSAIVFTTFSFEFLLPVIISILVGNIFLQYKKYIFIIIKTNMTLHAQYFKVYYKSSIILYYKSYAILYAIGFMLLLCHRLS